MHRTDTLNTDTTVDIDDGQAAVTNCSNPPAHSHLRRVFGYFAERAAPTDYEPNEQFDDTTSHNFASILNLFGLNCCTISCNFSFFKIMFFSRLEEYSLRGLFFFFLSLIFF